MSKESFWHQIQTKRNSQKRFDPPVNSTVIIYKTTLIKGYWSRRSSIRHRLCNWHFICQQTSLADIDIKQESGSFPQVMGNMGYSWNSSAYINSSMILLWLLGTELGLIRSCSWLIRCIRIVGKTWFGFYVAWHFHERI